MILRVLPEGFGSRVSRKCWENRGNVILSFALHADCITCLFRLFKAVTLGTGTGSVDTAYNNTHRYVSFMTFSCSDIIHKCWLICISDFGSYEYITL